MSAAAVSETPWRMLTLEQKRDALWKAGDLSWKVRSYQEADWDDWARWDKERQTSEHLAWVDDIGALYDNLWVDECGRRYGKTAKWLIADVQEGIRRPQARGLIFCAFQKSIGEIIVPLTKVLFKDAPKGYFPEYRGTHGAEHECLVIPATGSIIKLVGIDKHPDATRGQFLDFCHGSEAAFVKGLYDLITGNIMHQFQGRPWAWLALESSTAKVVDCDFNAIFREDARARGTYRKHNIRDNTLLSQEEIRKEERRSGGKTSANCQRELYCITTRDPDDMVIPEFDELVHVVDPRDWPRPKYALAHEGLDPGTTDPFGMVLAYLDWERQCFVIQAAWAKSNASTGEIVSKAQGFERDLWGSSHRRAGDKTPELSIADAVRLGPRQSQVWSAPQDALTYWDPDTRSLKANPYSRICDIDNQVLIDLNVDHGMNVRKAEKGPGSAVADLLHLRQLFEARPLKIVVLKNGHTEPLIQQLRSGMWNTDESGHRTDWLRSKVLGHLDCLAALKYVVRDVRWNRNPNLPAIVDTIQPDKHVPPSILDAARGKPMDVYGGRGSRVYGGRRSR